MILKRTKKPIEITCIAESQARWAFSVWILFVRNVKLWELPLERLENDQTNKQIIVEDEGENISSWGLWLFFDEVLILRPIFLHDTPIVSFFVQIVTKKEEIYLFNKSGTAWAGKSGGTKMEFGGGGWKKWVLNK